MKSSNRKIIVSCDLSQKDFMKIGGVEIKRANEFDMNYRERAPVIAQVKENLGELKEGDVILTHHNNFYAPSPYYLKDDLFAIPYGNTIFAVIDGEGKPKGVCGNIIAERILIKSKIVLPPEYRTYYKERGLVLADGYGYKKDEIVFTRPSALYEIVYVFNGIEKRIIKINSEMIIGKVAV